MLLNNIDEAKLFKKEKNDWIKLYHKTLQGIETIIDVQRQVKNIIKMAEETNTTITEIERNILKASVNNWIMNATNILSISEDLWTLIQSDIENQVYQIQQILDELNEYKERGNKYVDNNIEKIQELYRDEEIKKELKGKEI